VEPTNSILGVFVFQSYFQAEELAKRGIENFDTWVGYFGEIKGVVEPKIDGKWRVTQRLTDFINVAELAILWFSCVHYKRYQMVKEDFTKEDSRPLPEYVTVSNQMCDYQKKKMQEISDRYHALRNLEPWYFPQLDKQGYVLDKNGDRLTNPQTNKGIKDLSEAIALNLDPNYKIDNFLLLSGDSRRLMICPQLLEPSLPVDPNSKIIKIADNVIDIYKKNNQDRSTQVIFLDIGTPGGSSKFPLYQWFKDYFIAKAIPESEIAFLQDYKTPEAKEELFADFNEGKVRILLTSIEAGGIGVNIQKRLLAIHLANFPYRPDLIEQAEGRGLRSGNIHEKVYIYRYITEGSKSAHGADTVILQFLQTKQLLRDRFFNCDRSLRKISENDSAAELYMLLKAESTGDPNVIRYTELEVELEEKTVELALAQGELNRLNSTNSGSIEHTEKIIAMSRSRVLQIQQDIDRINSYDLYPYFACYLKETQELVIGIELVYPETKSDTEQPQYDHCPYPKNSDIVELQALFASAIGVDDGNKLILMPIAKAEAYVAQELIKTCLKNQEVLSQLEESRNRYLDLGFYSGFNLSATFWSNKNSSHLSLSLTGSFEWAIAFRKTPTLFIEKLKEIKSTIAEDQNIWRDHDRNNQNILEKMELRKVELQGQIKEFERQINDLEVEKSNLVKNLNIDDLL
jgi:hypothetical protein